MNFTELQNRLKFVLDFNDTQTDGAFTATRVKQALNLAYEREVFKAEAEGSRRYFKTTTSFTWPAGQLTYALTAPLSQATIIRMSDVTSTDPGYNLVFSEQGFSGDLHWKDRKTIQWGTTGPGSAKTIRVEYYPRPTELVEDEDELEMIPVQFHELLVWSAAVFLRTVADERPPQHWVNERDEFRIDFWKFLSQGRPISDTPTITNSHPDSDAGFVY